MSMTESEALEVFNSGCNDIYKVQVATHTAIKALSEIQQYRALEEKLSGITVKKVVEHFIKTVENQTEEEYTKGRILTNKEAEEWEQLKAIGTVSEFRELKEKATAKESYGIKCPHCNFYTSNGRYCCNCGKMLIAKSEGKE